MDDTIRAIMHFVRESYSSIISVKKIRDFYQIDSLNYSKINFYWRSLQELEEKGILKRVNSKIPKLYRVLNYYEFFNILQDSFVDNLQMAEALV
ncbi:MAG: hypothetical protein EAX89_17355 [Candidatus Lokiarchaeota archaeon]|nr:hypothetical protein [Candidatus Lokiarchaeota archaeon]